MECLAYRERLGIWDDHQGVVDTIALLSPKGRWETCPLPTVGLGDPTYPLLLREG